MVSQNTIEFRPQSLDRPATAMIEGVRAKFNGNAGQVLERMGEQQTFARAVEAGALDYAAVPGAPDFDSAVTDVDVHVRGHADCSAD